MSSLPTFDEFYRAANTGRVPLPWQSRLAERARSGDWPEEIGVPTGLGKTSCIDIAVWALAANAEVPPADRRIPTRIWWVVNRRLLVDAAYERGEVLTNLLADPSSVCEGWSGVTDGAVEALRGVGEALERIGAGTATRPLHLARLRGGVDLGARCPDPSQPSLIFSTVPMFATRWLFRGYGTSVGMRPVDAALAGVDSLVLLDEAHLARPLVELGAALAESDFGDPSVVINAHRAHPQIVALTATGERAGDRFDLDETDLAHPVVQERIMATKPAAVLQVGSPKELPRALGDAAEELLDSRAHSACVVFCNTVATARAVFEHLRRKLRGHEADVVLVTGRTREREAQRLRAFLLDPQTGAPVTGAATRQRSLAVVATQTLEVGADLDFDSLVTQTAGVRALTQRFGRMNRLGAKPHAAAVICHVNDGKSDPVYGTEPAQVWDRIKDSGTLDLSPARIGEILGQPSDVPPRSGTFLQAHLWEFVKTSAPPPDAAPPEVFFDPLDEERRDISICWRAHIPQDDVRLWPSVYENESIDVPIGELRTALKEHTEGIRRVTADRTSLETVETSQLRPGDHIVLPAWIGKYDEFGWNPESSETVLDVAVLDRQYLPLRWKPIRHLIENPISEEEEELEALLGSLDPSDPDEESDPNTDAAVVDKVMELLRSVTPHPWIEDAEWQSLLGALQLVVERAHGDTSFLQGARRGRRFAEAEVRVEALEELSFDLASARLTDHVGNVGDLAGKLGEAIGLQPPMIDALKQAGYFHDVGKADPRFQRWLAPNTDGSDLLAKSSVTLLNVQAARIAARWPPGGRHELLSGRVFEEWLALNGPVAWDADLTAHLIATHHGGGRPLVATVADPHAGQFTVEVAGVSVRADGDLSRCDFDQASRFRHQCERFGAWGVALFEAIVRQADHLVSRAAGGVQ
ncbi:MAG TPA: type I-U CRISPR-associated helicase/endonuclease Cas3 [Actinomycetota bacterium]